MEDWKTLKHYLVNTLEKGDVEIQPTGCSELKAVTALEMEQ